MKGRDGEQAGPGIPKFEATKLGRQHEALRPLGGLKLGEDLVNLC